MRVVGLQLSNIRCIKALDLNLSNGALVKISGPNGSGKSTVLDTLATVFTSGKIAPHLVASSEANGKVVARMDNGFTVIKEFHGDGSTKSVTVTDEKKRRIGSPGAWIKAVTNGLVLNPMEFALATNQRDLLLQYLNVDVDSYDIDIKNLEYERLLVGRKRKSKGEYKNITRVDRVDTVSLMREYQEIIDWNKAQEDNEKAILMATTEVERLEKALEDARERLNKLSEPQPRKDEKLIKLKIENASTINLEAEMWENNEALKGEIDSLEAEYRRLGEYIETKRYDRSNVLKNAGLPEGVEIRGTDIIVNGVASKALSTAESLLFAIEICKLCNPTARTMLIYNGNNLDSKSLEKVEEFAETNSFQVIMEYVSEEPTGHENEVYIVEGQV